MLLLGRNYFFGSLLVFKGAQGHGHHHHHHDHDDHEHDGHSHGQLRGLSASNGNIFAPPGQCKDGDPTFTIGGKTYPCEEDFNAAGGQCKTPDETPEVRTKKAAAFQAWLERKGKGKWKGKGKGPKDKRTTEQRLPGNRRLGGCGSVDCVDWGDDWDAPGQVITIPVHFHIFHNGADGKQFICNYSQGSGFTEIDGGDCKYVKDQMIVLNKAFRGEKMDLDQPTQYETNTKIQFCLQGANDIEGQSYDSAGNYADNNESYKATFRAGEMETLNIWVNQAGGYLGYAYFPTSNFATRDGVVLLNTSMPRGGTNNFQEGDTLPHEVGHWLGLEHTFQGGCSSNTGDYNDLAGNAQVNERTSADGCPLGRDTCSGDGGADPIHNFMDYTYDTCMDEFNPGQALQMQFSWETYRHEVNYSELWNLAADGISCTQEAAPTGSPTSPQPTTSPNTASPTTKCVPFKVDVVTDGYATETSWELINVCNGNQVQEVNPEYSNDTEYSNEYCVPPAEYTFVFNDSFGDGICCGYGQGSYEVFYDGISEIASGGEFGSSESTTFGSCGPIATADPTQSPTRSPTSNPSQAPSSTPTSLPTSNPTNHPTIPIPTKSPSKAPTDTPSTSPSKAPSEAPTTTVPPPTTTTTSTTTTTTVPPLTTTTTSVTPSSPIPIDGSIFNQSGSLGDVQQYHFTISAGSTATCSTGGSNGDADLYMRFNAEADPTIGSLENECESISSTSNESCTTSAASEGTEVYAGVHAYLAYSGLTVTCTENTPISCGNITRKRDCNNEAACRWRRSRGDCVNRS